MDTPTVSVVRPRAALTALLLLAALSPAGAAAQSSGGTEPTGGTPPETITPAPTAAPDPAFRGTGMWIWQLPRTYGGSISRIVAKARRHGVTTLFLKSGDGLHVWDQFSPSVVSAFKDAGLKVCGWQYVYGNSPIGEANVSATAKRKGADCFVIDAEAEYEGKYVSADLYVRRLRALVGRSYPISLAGLPYVDFHPGFPYSVFLAPGAADANQPQMYWYTIGTSVDRNFSHTYTWNRVYQRPIFPLGQTYDRTPAAQIRRFRQVAQAYGAPGVSWWEWVETAETSWRALGDPVAALTQYRAATGYPRLRLRSKGDYVVWAQQHLYGAGYVLALTGIFNAPTRDAVMQFQDAQDLPITGELDDPTWTELLKVKPVAVRWRKVNRKTSKAVPVIAARRGVPVVAAEPLSAKLPARGHEIPRRRG
jgi:putative peptidoglycan binding protein